ncbi:tRNA (adenosine(37)-N6)-threonylcarbamoyltransferase complex ATPase subunit type 1 TsaE [Oceanidesulfovibrio indonesiensis]|uniref:tRNA threonylcarbamoyladenosine biosynthesis protein TsaE n=1 Tax=Oceanidesulfovibrio indonesiensis TaxID=54767 RepID=A0A7M3MC11_9BACT|nr:tRNA (adenosine(37)-N6)-threonylcarbamoyltransferase complex ATPase subunit type 1 TsaE [Oceanidesulfovibrio indonesiensis]TVM15852.1 tRNA (adenosine(37)-N6)-threonylcarbamoyltransferase complex ATPase subunit type 1 TsaE [Oceanidesulfovibrio indonesiensis]
MESEHSQEQTTLLLADEEATVALGRTLGLAWRRQWERGTPSCRTLLLTGPLGAGKTTLVRGLVQALPGGGDAEVSSPSFTLANHYPTAPEVAHADLYRLAGGAADWEILDLLDEHPGIVVMEWSELVPESELPEHWLLITLQPAEDSCEAGRVACIAASTPACAQLLDSLPHCS